MKLAFKAGTTSKDINIFIQDSSVSTGAGLSGLAYNSGSLTAYYHRQGASSATAITLATKTVGTWATGGFVAVDGTNLPGLYELGIPDAALASGATWVIIMLKGASNMAPVVLEIELLATDNQDSVRMGLTALPNAAAAANGGLPTVDANNAVKLQSGTGSNQISLSSGLVTLAGVTHTGATIPTVTTTTTATNVTTVNGLASGVITATSIAADAITAAKIADGAIDAATFASGAINAAAIATDAITAAKIAADAIGASELAADAVAEIQSGLATPTNITAGTITTVTNLTNAPTVGDFTATMKTSITTAASSATPSVTVSDKTGFSLSSAGIQAIWDKATSLLTTSGSIGKFIVDNLNASTIASAVASAIGSLTGIAAADIWSYTGGSGRTLTTTTPGASLVATTSGPALSMTMAVSYSVTITGLTIPSTWTKIYFTAKGSLGDPDSHAMLQLVESNPGSGSDGLLYINGQTPATFSILASDGDLTVDRPGGNITITITDDAAVNLSTGNSLAYDVKMLTSDSKSQILTTGTLSIGTTPTLSIS